MKNENEDHNAGYDPWEWISLKDRTLPFHKEVRVKLADGIVAYAYRDESNMLICFTRFGNYTTSLLDVACWQDLPDVR